MQLEQFIGSRSLALIHLVLKFSVFVGSQVSPHVIEAVAEVGVVNSAKNVIKSFDEMLQKFPPFCQY